MFTTAMRACTRAVSMIVFTSAAAFAQHDDHQLPAPLKSNELVGGIFCADGPPLPGAIVQLFTKTELRASALSDKAGRFRLRVVPGIYTLRINYLGHVDLAREVAIAGNSVTNLGELRLDISAVEVEAVVATAERDRVRIRPGALIFNTKRSAAAMTGSVADVIRNVPGLEIDTDGRITLRGDANVQLLINGRTAALKDAALVAFLKQMPAASLRSIEVATTGSAAQDADGTAGTVNLQFAESESLAQSTSFSGSLSAASPTQYMVSFAGAGAVRELRWDAAYAASLLEPHTAVRTVRDNPLATAGRRILQQVSHADAQHMLHSLQVGAAQRAGARSEIDASFSASWMRGLFDSTTDFDGVSATSNLRHAIPNADLSVGWNFNDPQSRVRMNTALRYIYVREDFDGQYANANGERFLSTDMRLTRDEFQSQTDVGLDIRGARVELGHKLSASDLDAGFLSERAGIEMTESFGHSRLINAAYASVTRAVKGRSFQVGLRAEMERTRIALGSRVVEDDALRLFPSMAMHWPHNAAREFEYRLAYARRVHRPDAASLNPFSMGEDDMNSFIGNPFLQSEVTDQIELGMTRHSAAGAFQLTPYVRLSTHPNRPLKAVSASGHATTTMHNLDRARSAGIDLSVSGRLNELVNVMVASNISYGEVKGATIERDGMFFSVRASVDLRLARETSLQFYAFRRGAQIVEQGRILPSFTSEIAVLHRFAGSRGAMAVRLNDVFDSNRLAFHLEDASFSQHSERRNTSRRLVISLSWGIGPSERRPDPETPARIF